MAHSFVPLLFGGSESPFLALWAHRAPTIHGAASWRDWQDTLVMEQGSILSHSPPQPHPASSLEVSIVVLPKRLQDDGDNCHEGFHNAELQCGLHRGETPCTMGSRTSHSPTSHPSAPGTHTQRREQCCGVKYEQVQGLQMGGSGASRRQLLKGSIASPRWGTKGLGDRQVTGFSPQCSPGE